MGLSWIDILLLVIVVLSVVSGWRRGFILSMLDLVRWVGSWLAALVLYKPVSIGIGYLVDWGETWTAPVAFILVVILTGILIQRFGWAVLRWIPREIHKHRINRAFGTLPGLLSGLVMAALVSALLFAMPFSDAISEKAQNSPIADRFAVYTDELEDLLAPIFEPAIRQTLNRLITVEPGSTERVELPFKVANSHPAPTLEARMLELVNQERTSRGLKPLEADPELTEVARRHSADMFERGYFAHYTPEGKDPFDRMRAANVHFTIAGENLALAPTLQIAHTGLMNSPGHRANILRPQFGRVGIGIMDGGRRGLMVSQEFRN